MNNSIVFDLDDTICFTNHKYTDTENKYGKALPNNKVIRAMHTLKDKGFHITILTAGFVSFGLAIWGGFELWNNSCKDLKESNLWSFGVLCFSLQIFETFLLLIFPPLIVFLIKCWLENDNYTVSNSRSNR